MLPNELTPVVDGSPMQHGDVFVVGLIDVEPTLDQLSTSFEHPELRRPHDVKVLIVFRRRLHRCWGCRPHPHVEVFGRGRTPECVEQLVLM